ncbi:hypothetical protein MPSEU_000707000 [Mayamaea pseudoterrestris]|nr:hypothetical protein MPSEU_000707000 [Mayamaea pseudoterrestris]
MTMLASDAFRALAAARVSCKRFEPNKLIPESVLGDILATTIRSPSSFNLQPTQIVMVSDQAIKEQLSQKAMIGPGNQYRCRDCSLLAVFLSDLEAGKRISRIAQLEREWGQRHPAYMATLPLSTAFMLGEGHAATLMKQLAMDAFSLAKPMPSIEPISVWASKNTSILVQQFVLAATSHNLATALMEGIDPRRVKEILDIPDRYSIPMIAATGYEWSETPENEPKTPRLSIEEVVFREKFGIGWKEQGDELVEDEMA